MKYKTTSIYDHAHPKIIKATFGFSEFGFGLSVHSWDTLYLATPIFNHA